jgi:4-diphosphocytidyl-2C-methyl-D-erythritol kinase
MNARAARVTVEARAKLNLGLRIGPRRDDGYHELATFFQSISLADTLTALPARSGFTLRVCYEDAAAHRATPRAARGARSGASGVRADSLRARERIPAGAENLVLRAARLVALRAGLDRGARFTLIKRIPIQSGLGGGSADAVAAMVALDRLYRLKLGAELRAALAAELGSDVPFALRGGTALGLGRGERLTSVRLVRPFRAVIAVPSWRVSTARAFNQIDLKKLPLTQWTPNLRFAKKLAVNRLLPERAIGMGNTFEGVLEDRAADFHSLCARMRAAGLRDLAMTGSGSAVFGLRGQGTSFAQVAHEFTGSEPLYDVRSVLTGWKMIAV